MTLPARLTCLMLSVACVPAGAVTARVAASAPAVASAPAAAASASEATHRPAPMTVRIGAALPLSGAQQPYGREVLDAMRMAVADLDAQDLRIGGRPVRWVLDARDDTSGAAATARALVADGVAAVVGDLGSRAVARSAPVYFAAGVPQITPSAGDPKLAQRGWQTFHRIVANDDALGAALALYAGRRLHARRAMIVGDDSSTGRGVARAFERAAPGAGLQMLPAARASAVAPLVAAVRAAAPDVVLYRGRAVFGAALLRALRVGGVHARFLGARRLCSRDFARLAGRDADADVVCVQGGDVLDRTPAGTAWRQRFDALYGAGVFQLYAPYAYDATMVLAHAMVAAGSSVGRDYAPLLRQRAFAGVTRRDIRFNVDGELLRPHVTIDDFSHGAKQALNR